MSHLWVLRRRKQSSQPGSFSLRRVLLAALRLVGFGLLSLLVVLAALLIYIDYRTVLEEIAPAHQPVDLPPDLPFAPEEVTFSGGDGIQLAGWYIPGKKATIIVLHGYGGTRAGMLWHAQRLVESGYGVLLYDERASGESTGTRRSYGWEDGPDVTGAVRFLRSRESNGEIGILGCSIGGQIALQGAIQNPEISAVWADGPSNLRALDNPPVRNALHGLVLASNYLLDFMYILKLGIAAPAPMIEQIGQIAPRPIMLVGGGVELGSLGSEADRVWRYGRFAGDNAQVWVIEEATHCDGPAKQPDVYARRMVEFFDRVFAMK